MATPFCVPTNTLPFAIVGVMNLLPGPNRRDCKTPESLELLKERKLFRSGGVPWATQKESTSYTCTSELRENYLWKKSQLGNMDPEPERFCSRSVKSSLKTTYVMLI